MNLQKKGVPQFVLPGGFAKTMATSSLGIFAVGNIHRGSPHAGLRLQLGTVSLRLCLLSGMFERQAKIFLGGPGVEGYYGKYIAYSCFRCWAIILPVTLCAAFSADLPR